MPSFRQIREISILKSIGVTVILMLMLSSVPRAASRLEVGLKSGVTTLNVYGDLNAGPVRFRTGVCGGVYVALTINANLIVQGEIALSSRAYRRQYLITYVGETSSVTEIDRITYLELPLLVKFPFPSGSSFQLSPYLGFLTALRVKARATGDYSGVFGLEGMSYSERISNAKALDVEPLVGADLSCRVTKTLRAHLDLRMWFGLRTLYRDDRTLYTDQQDGLPVVDYSTGTAPDQKSTGLSLTIGLGWL